MEFPIAVKNKIPIALAPMAGVTDHVFRRLCVLRGCDITYTEMVSAKGLLYGGRRTRELIRIADEERPAAVQLFGSEPAIMAAMARMLCNEYAADLCLIDINMGCPAHKIVSNGEGSALMRDVVRAAAVTEAVVKASGLPVSVKFRKGWDESHINAVEFARAMQNSGASMLTLHGRTREQMYHGAADWDIIAEVAAKVRIPVLGNGDVTSGAAAVKLLSQTGCAGIMVARGAQGNPFIFEELRSAIDGLPYTPPTDYERMTEAILHAERFLAERGAALFAELRKHMAWYAKGMRGAIEFRRAINAAASPDELLEQLYNFRQRASVA